MNKILSLALLVMLCATSFALLFTKENSTTLPGESATGKAAVGGDFTLINTEGKTVNEPDFHGKYTLVFFGFTRCPDICPTAMTTLTGTMESLKDKASLVTPIFISVDPKNDTPKKVKEFLSNFDSRIVGLTGSEAQVEKATSVYKIYHAEENGSVNHSALIYLMDKNGEYVTHFPSDISVDVLTKKLMGELK